jgi:RNA polymerase sigma-70 factor (ECF subfamily)
MLDQSWSWTTAWSNSTPEMLSGPVYQDGRTCVIKVRLEANRTYGYWLNTETFNNFKDADGRAAIPYLLIFQTRAKE